MSAAVTAAGPYRSLLIPPADRTEGWETGTQENDKGWRNRREERSGASSN